MGNMKTLHARIDVDEYDIKNLRIDAKAIISPQGNSETKLHGKLVRVDPFVKPKRTLSGSSIELVDTRVLQLIFEIEEQNPPVFAGQQVDAYIESHSSDPYIAGFNREKK